MYKIKKFLISFFSIMLCYTAIRYIHNNITKTRHISIQYMKIPTNKLRQKEITEAIELVRDYMQDRTLDNIDLDDKMLLVANYINTELELKPTINLITYHHVMSNIPKIWYKNSPIINFLYKTTDLEEHISQIILALHAHDIELYKYYLSHLPQTGLSAEAEAWILLVSAYSYNQSLLNLIQYHLKTY